TSEHPFFVVGKGWLEAGKLSAGDSILTISGEPARIEKIAPREQRLALFNFEVEADHSYFVGETALLVHNAPKINLAPPTPPKVRGHGDWKTSAWWQTEPHAVYRGSDGYVGLTDDFARRRRDWAREGRSVLPLHENIPGRLAGRGVEQVEIEAARARGE